MTRQLEALKANPQWGFRDGITLRSTHTDLYAE